MADAGVEIEQVRVKVEKTEDEPAAPIETDVKIENIETTETVETVTNTEEGTTVITETTTIETVEKTGEKENLIETETVTETKVVTNGTVKHEERKPSALAPADNIVTTERDGAVKIKLAEGAEKPITAVEFFERVVEKFPNRPALKVERDGQWITWTYKEYLEDVKTTAKAFIKVSYFLILLID